MVFHCLTLLKITTNVTWQKHFERLKNVALFASVTTLLLGTIMAWKSVASFDNVCAWSEKNSFFEQTVGEKNSFWGHLGGLTALDFCWAELSQQIINMCICLYCSASHTFHICSRITHDNETDPFADIQDEALNVLTVLTVWLQQKVVEYQGWANLPNTQIKNIENSIKSFKNLINKTTIYFCYGIQRNCGCCVASRKCQEIKE